MFKVKVKDELISHCRDEVEKYNFGQRGVADGNKEEQYVGCIGESVVREFFGLEWLDGSKGFDGGRDIEYEGIKIDVKTMGRTTDVKSYYVNNFIGLQKNYEVDIYIFTSFNKVKNELTICGWIPKKELFEKASFYKKGTKRYRSDGTYFKTKADLYEIPNSELYDVNSIEELKKSLIEYKGKNL